MARSPRLACRATSTPSRRPLSAAVLSADRNEVVEPDPLDDQELARAAVDALDMMGGLRRYRAALPRFQAIEVPRRAGLDHHRTLEADKAVADLVVVMPRDFLPGRQGQYRDAHI